MTTKAVALKRLYPWRSEAEAVYAKRLEVSRAGGALQDYRFEPITFKLADDTRYTPDFMVIANDNVIEFHEVKGFMRAQARVKIKVAVQMFPWFRWYICWSQSGGRFEIEEIT